MPDRFSTLCGLVHKGCGGAAFQPLSRPQQYKGMCVQYGVGVGVHHRGDIGGWLPVVCAPVLVCLL